MNHDDRSTKPFIEHLIELRNRLLIVFVCLGITTVIGYQFYGALLRILLAPLHQSVYYTSPLGGFNFSLQLSLLFGMLASSPVVLYQLFRFVGPALPDTVQRRTVPLIYASLVLMLSGAAFAYFVGLPTALHFLSGFSSGGIHSLISATDYLTFATRYLLGFSLLFQLPIFLVIVNYIKPVRAKAILKYQRHVVAASFIIGIILSPAVDPLDMTLMALPLILLYYISIVFILLVNRRGTVIAVLSNICYFLVVTLVSALFGIALLFSYATYQAVQRNHIPLQRVFVLPSISYLDSLMKTWPLIDKWNQINHSR